MLGNQTCYDSQQQKKKKKEEKKETHNYLDFSKYFLYLYIKFCKVTDLCRFSPKLFQILAP